MTDSFKLNIPDVYRRSLAAAPEENMVALSQYGGIISEQCLHNISWLWTTILIVNCVNGRDTCQD